MLGVTGTAAITGLILSGLKGERLLFSIPVALLIGLFSAFSFYQLKKEELTRRRNELNRSKKFIAVVLSFFIFATPSVASANTQQTAHTQVLSEKSFRALEKPSEYDLKVISSYIVERDDIFQVDPNRIDVGPDPCLVDA